MAIIVNDTLQSNSPKSLDNKYLKNGVTPYASVAEANSFIISQYRSLGLTVLIGNQEYWYLGGVLDNNLILKSTTNSVTWGNITGTLSNQVDLQNILSQKEPGILPGTVLQYWRGDKTWQTLTSDVVTEGSTNLYFTTPRARLAVSAGTGISYNNTTGVITSTIVAQVNSDWNAVSGLAQILNKPSIPAAQVNSDWNAVSGVAQILNKPTIPAQVNPIAGSGILITGSYPNLTFAATAGGGGTVTSITLTMPSAFTVTGSPITTSGTFAITGAGTTSQYIRGDGTLATTNLGSVTSVTLTVPSGLTVSGSPVTSSGTLAITTTLNGVVHANGSGFTASNVNLASEVIGNLAVSHFNSGTNASGATYFRGDGTWQTPPVTSPAGTTGSIQFNNAGAFFADNNLFWDNVNKRLGVGNPAPVGTLDINSNSSTGTTLAIGSSATATTAPPTLALTNDTGRTGGVYVQSSIGGTITSGYTTLYATSALSGIILSIAGDNSMMVAPSGVVTIKNLVGSGTRMVVASPSGVLQTQAIGAGGTVTSVALTASSAFTIGGSPITGSGTLTLTGAGSTAQYIRGDGTLATFPTVGSVTSVGASITGTAITVSGSPITTTGTLAFAFAGTISQYVSGAGSLITFPTIPTQFAPVAGSGITLTGTYPNITFSSTRVSSVGLTMPSAFTVSGSPVTSSGTLAVTGAGTISQYIRGDGSLATFPSIGTGSVTSVDGSGGSTGLTLTGGPITTSGVLTLGGTLSVSSGGTGLTSANTYSVLVGGTTTGGPLQQVATNGTSGQYLGSNGTGTLPSWKNFPTGANTIYTGDGTLTGNRDVNGAAGDGFDGFNLTFDGIGKYKINAITFQVIGAVQYKYTSVTTSSYTISNQDYFVDLLGSTTGTLNLPTIVAGTTDGRVLVIRNRTGNTWTLNQAIENSPDGSTGSLLFQGVLTLMATASIWVITGTG